MSNFSFLSLKTEYALFAPACVEAEKIYASAPALCAVGCRKAMELAIKWVYAADQTMKMPYKDNLKSWYLSRASVLPWTITPGASCATSQSWAYGRTYRAECPAGDALAALRGLFEFVQWIDYCYGSDYQDRIFDQALIPTQKVAVDAQKVKAQESLLEEQKAEIEALRRQVEQMRPGTPPKRRSTSRSAVSIRRTCLNSRPASGSLMWT